MVETIAFGQNPATETSQAKNADALAARFADELARYQNDAYAERYRTLIARVRGVDAKHIGKNQALTEAVARYYFKLMAIKDEYEVARLYSDGSFLEALKQEFEGDLRLEFHMAPPILQRRDKRTGRYPKRTFGRGTMLLYSILARLKFLRGTPFDLFGYDAHRRAERALIADYEAIIDDLLKDLTPETYDLAVEIASYPELIRGYDVVKDEHLEKARAHLAGLRERYSATTAQTEPLVPAE